MEEWTGEFVEIASSELKAMVEDWQYDFGASDRECSALPLWVALRLDPVLLSRFNLKNLDR